MGYIPNMQSIKTHSFEHFIGHLNVVRQSLKSSDVCKRTSHWCSRLTIRWCENVHLYTRLNQVSVTVNSADLHTSWIDRAIRSVPQ